MTADRRSAVLRGAVRGGLVIVIAGCGLALSSAAYLWRGTTSGAVLLIVGTMAAMAALVRLYATRRPLRFAGVPLGFGVVALFVFGIVGVTAARDVAMTLVGVDATRSWRAPGRPPRAAVRRTTARCGAPTAPRSPASSRPAARDTSAATPSRSSSTRTGGSRRSPAPSRTCPWSDNSRWPRPPLSSY
ncbi:hypothetical protein BJF79_40050 [Actinomadura sp. CNU-125]|uniref:hypothetical protein n=1 Tax=Actinomadura sp. CNU-125 TaxID=1904961 RepID=UPI000967F4C4|nr:hypothetical protein [Actinomadura sp. CNU-125]OLT30004.1 hypothetical protein BJF79_40050 [Actinomadura sp. CNU-125]